MNQHELSNCLSYKFELSKPVKFQSHSLLKPVFDDMGGFDQLTAQLDAMSQKLKIFLIQKRM